LPKPDNNTTRRGITANIADEYRYNNLQQNTRKLHQSKGLEDKTNRGLHKVKVYLEGNALI
jgi:hypothetical protein